MTIKIINNLKIELVTFLKHLKSIYFTFLINKRKYVEHNNICEKRRRSAEIIIKKYLKIVNII